MHPITRKMIDKRGCIYCTDIINKPDNHQNHFFCPYDNCIYKELGNFDNYEEYFRSKEVLNVLDF